jgi:hypothetical protein
MSARSKVVQEEELIERLLEQQPYAKATLERLRVRLEGRDIYGVFAPIKSGGCGACNLAIATGQLQSAQKGVFIICANCSRLYVAEFGGG